jgi:hypothetical protein
MFSADLSFGNRYEKLVARKIVGNGNGGNVIFAEGCFKPYDVVIDGIKYEVKADRNAYKYNSFFIEYDNNRNPSGINATECDYWVHIDARPTESYSKYYKIPIDVLRNAIKRPEVYKKHGGDRNASSGYIVKREWFTQYEF